MSATVAWKTFDTGASASPIVSNGRFRLASPGSVLGSPSLAMQSAAQLAVVNVYSDDSERIEAVLTVSGTTLTPIVNAAGQPFAAQQLFGLSIEVTGITTGEVLYTTDEPNGSPSAPFASTAERNVTFSEALPPPHARVWVGGVEYEWLGGVSASNDSDWGQLAKILPSSDVQFAGAVLSKNTPSQISSISAYTPNVFPESGVEVGKIVTNDGQVVDFDATWGLSDYIQIPTESYAIVRHNDANEFFGSDGGWYDANKNWAGRLNGRFESRPQTAVFVRINYVLSVLQYVGFVDGENKGFNESKLTVLGDSIMTKVGSNLWAIPDLIKKYLGLGAIQNLAVGGKTLAGANAIWSLCPQISTKSQFVLLEGGVNDYINTVPIGEIGVAINTDTVYGALEYIANFFAVSRPYQRLIMTTPLRTLIPLSGLVPLSDYAEAIRSVGKKYGIPVIDNSECPVNIGSEVGAALYSIDGLHPNNAALHPIASFLAKEFSKCC